MIRKRDDQRDRWESVRQAAEPAGVPGLTGNRNRRSGIGSRPLKWDAAKQRVRFIIGKWNRAGYFPKTHPTPVSGRISNANSRLSR